MPALPPVTKTLLLGIRIAPADPKSSSIADSVCHSCGVYQSTKERLLPERCSTESPKFVTPSQSPFPVTAYTSPLLSIAGARPECQNAPCRPFGALLNAAVNCSVAA